MSDSSSWYQRKLGRGTPRQQPIPAYQQRVVPQQPQQFSPEPPPDRGVVKVTIDNLWDAMSQYRGGQAHRTERQPCPACGGNRFYSRSQGIRRGPPPAPLCWDCGYNGGMFDQGLESTWSG